MAAIYSNGDNRWNILGFNFTKRDALSSLYKISMGAIYFKYLTIIGQRRGVYWKILTETNSKRQWRLALLWKSRMEKLVFTVLFTCG
jgi:hypothetical protein